MEIYLPDAMLLQDILRSLLDASPSTQREVLGEVSLEEHDRIRILKDSLEHFINS